MFRTPDGYMVSDDEKIAVKGQRLFADPSIIEAANKQLEDAGARVRLKLIPPTSFAWIKFDNQGRGAQLHRFVPVWQEETVGTSFHRPLNRRNADSCSEKGWVDGYITWSDCHHNSQTVMGATNERGRDWEPEHPLVRLAAEDDEKTPLRAPQSSPLAKTQFTTAQYADQHAHRGAYAALAAIIPYTPEREKYRPATDANGVPVPAADRISGLWQVFLEELRTEDTLNWQERHWINWFVHPEIGEGLCMIPPKQAPGFTSSYAWTDLKELFADEPDAMAALGLDPNGPEPSYATIRDKITQLEVANFDTLRSHPNNKWPTPKGELTGDKAIRQRGIDQESSIADMERVLDELNADDPTKLNAAQRRLVRDALIRRYWARELKRPSCTLAIKDTLIHDLESGVELTTIIAKCAHEDLVYMLKHQILYLGFNGRQRDELTAEALGRYAPEVWLQSLRGKAMMWKDPWNFHWAGVVLVSGHDYVTLENLSVEAEDYPNYTWFFHMYRRLDAVDEYDAHHGDTFHGQNLRSGGFGDIALTLSFKFIKPAPRPIANMPRKQPATSASHPTLALKDLAVSTGTGEGSSGGDKL